MSAKQFEINVIHYTINFLDENSIKHTHYGIVYGL